MPNNEDTTPDLILHTKNISNNLTKIDVLPDLGSDHLSLVVNLDLLKPTTPEVPVVKYNFKKCQVGKVNEEMMHYLETIKNTAITGEAIVDFNNKLSDVILKNTPTSSNACFNHELPPYIIKLIKTKRKMLRDYQQQPNPDIKRQINEFNKNIHNMIYQYRTHKWWEACDEINKKRGRNFYQQVKKLSRYKTQNIVPTIIENGKEYSTDKQKADIFAEIFEGNYAEADHPNYNQELFNNVNEWYTNYFQQPVAHDENQNKVEEEIYFTILANQKNSAPGVDKIPWLILKQVEYEIHLHIMKMFEYCLANQYFPDIWKTGTVIVIPKPNTDHKRANNYRPITLLPVLGKLLEKIIKTKIAETVQNRIPVHQFGFKQKSSTLHPLTVLVSNVQTAKLNNLKSGALFLDTTKAFDSVWHKGLLYKLKKIGVTDSIIHLIKSFLELRLGTVKINNTFSEEFIMQQGVPQGSSLSPVLYNIYCYDIYQQPITPPRNAYILQYADDTVLIAHEKSRSMVNSTLQNALNTIQEWLNKWRLQANPLKSQYIIFYHSPTNASPSISFNNQQVHPAVTAKYLGVHLDNKLNFNYHSKMAKRRITMRAKHFRALTYKNTGITTNNATRIYKSICRPVIEYGHPLFLNCRKPALHNLQVAERSSLRTITKIRHPNNPLHNPSNELLYDMTKVQPIEERLKRLSHKFAANSFNLELIAPLIITRNEIPRRCRYPEKSLYEILTELATDV